MRWLKKLDHLSICASDGVGSVRDEWRFSSSPARTYLPRTRLAQLDCSTIANANKIVLFQDNQSWRCAALAYKSCFLESHKANQPFGILPFLRTWSRFWRHEFPSHRGPFPEARCQISYQLMNILLWTWAFNCRRALIFFFVPCILASLINRSWAAWK